MAASIVPADPTTMRTRRMRTLLVAIVALLAIAHAEPSTSAAERRPLDPWSRSFLMLKEAQQQRISPPVSTSSLASEDNNDTASASNIPVDQHHISNQPKRKPKKPIHRPAKPPAKSDEPQLNASSATAAIAFYAAPPPFAGRDELQQRHQHQHRQQSSADSRLVIHQRVTCRPCKIVPHHHVPPPSSSSHHLLPTVQPPKRPRECQCNPFGSIGRTCHRHTGQCQCRPNVVGRQCDQCAPGFRHPAMVHRSNATLTTTTTLVLVSEASAWCTECTCNALGSRNNECHPHTGHCSCHTGVTGADCDRCDNDHYGFSERGCKRCDECLNSAFVCDGQTGRCVCPPLSRGPDCQQCVPNAWGWRHRLGCERCDCDHHGTFEQKCNVQSGDCRCRLGFDGRRCDRCAPGYYGYPRCEPCGCNRAGSLREQCDDRGQCACKELVTGLKCDRCRQATYGLDERNVLGCLRCFCFGRTQECDGSDWTWGQIRAHGARNLSVERVNDSGDEFAVVMQMRGTVAEYRVAELEKRYDLQLIPSTVGNVSMATRSDFERPLYFELPAQYAGDRLGSYGGWLNYSIWADGVDDDANGGSLPLDVLRRFPLVQMHTHSALVLDYYGPQILDAATNVSHSVGMNESFWRYRFSEQNVTRAIMLTALQNVRRIFVRATAWPTFDEVVIGAVTLDAAYYVSGTRSNLAHSVEMCRCPPEYNGTSCQDPAEGFYRWKNAATDDEKQLHDFVGVAKRCECSGRSETCDRETGNCLNCRQRSGGAHCEQCSEGYYGDPNYADGCEPCPCPETNRNFARGCTVRQRRVMCICRPGYEGALCDRCAPGYFGQPNDERLGGNCTACDCDADGTDAEAGTECHRLTGQCRCKAGLTGRRCDRCDASRSMLQDGVCRVCDNCTLTLLRRTDDLRTTFERSAGHLDLDGVPAPWLALLDYSNRSDALAQAVRVEAKRLADRIRQLDDAPVDKLQLRAGHLSKLLYRLTERVALARSSGEQLTAVELLGSDAQRCTDDILGTIDELNGYGRRSHQVNLPAALREAKAMLDDLKDAQRGGGNRSETLACAQRQYEHWTQQAGELARQQRESDALLRNATALRRRVDAAQALADRADETLRVARDSHADNERNYDMLRAHFELIRKLKDELSEALNSSLPVHMDTLTGEHRGQVDSARANAAKSQRLAGLLDRRTGERTDAVQAVAQRLPAAAEHSGELQRRADEYARLFQTSRNGAELALQASSAHTSIVDAIEAARQSVVQADAAVRRSHAELHGSSDGASIVERGLESMRRSGAVESEALGELRKLDDLVDQLAGQKRTVDSATSRIWQTALLNNEMTTQLNAIDGNVSRKASVDSAGMASKVSDQMRKVHREASDIGADVYKLKMKLSSLEPQWDSQFGGAEENVSQALGNLITANRTLVRLESVQTDQTDAFQRWNETIGDSMQALRDKIAKARHAAEAIRISMQSAESSEPQPACMRSYEPRSVGVTTSNALRLSVARSNDADAAGHSPLLFVPGSVPGTFLALEMRANRVHLAWNLGGRTGQLTHPLVLRQRDARHNDAWYAIEVNRTMHLCTLSVTPADRGWTAAGPASVHGASDPEHTRLQTTRSDRVWLGGVPASASPNDTAILAGGERPFAFVVHTLHVDDEPVGLWNFVQSPGPGCRAAMAGPHQASTTLSGSASWHFNGHGYSTVQKKSRLMRVPRTRFSMQLTFRTFDENALLFVAVDQSTNRSVSLTLHRGRLLFRIDYGNASRLEIQTRAQYNDGNWTKVVVARHFATGTESGLLTIPGREEQSGSPTTPITLHMLPELSRAVYYLGGVPPGFRSGTTKAPGADHAFLGCLRDIQVNGESYDPLESSAYFGVEPNCRDTITLAGFHGSGWMRLPAPALRKRANFGLVLRTDQPDALVLLACSPEPALGNYSVSLLDGRPHVWLQSSAGGQPVRLSANRSLSDGDWHVIAVQKTGCRVELRVDDQPQDAARFEAHACAVQLDADASLYVGGAPNNLEKYDGQVAPTFGRFVGTIRDVMFNNGTVAFDEQLRGFTQVQLGRMGPALRRPAGRTDASAAYSSQTVSDAAAAAAGSPAGALESASASLAHRFAEMPEGCHRVGSYSYEPNAFKFGDGPHSHSIVSVATRVNLWQKDFSLAFDFRTFYPNGVLFLAPGTKEKQKHYIGLVLRDGQLQLMVRGRKRDQVTVPRRLNDGHWHNVRLDSSAKLLTIRITDTVGDDRLPLSTQYRLPRRLSATNAMFVGGLSETAGGSLPPELMLKMEQFKGCIRGFRMNNATQDLVRPGRHSHVGQCFPSVEKGSYFPGDAYVVYKNNFHVGKYLELGFEFRTSELNGVLLSVSEPSGFPALSIELFDGKVVMSCDLGDGNPFRIETAPLPSRYTLCDNRWHNISAMYDSEQLALRIDQQPSVMRLAQRRDTGNKVHTKSPLFIGGLHEQAPSGTLLARDNFKGCIRNVLIRNERRDWTDMDELHNVVLSECLAID